MSNRCISTHEQRFGVLVPRN